MADGHLFVLRHHQCGRLHKLIPCTVIYVQKITPAASSSLLCICRRQHVGGCVQRHQCGPTARCFKHTHTPSAVLDGTASLWFYLQLLAHTRKHILIYTPIRTVFKLIFYQYDSPLIPSGQYLKPAVSPIANEAAKLSQFGNSTHFPLQWLRNAW